MFTIRNFISPGNQSLQLRDIILSEGGRPKSPLSQKPRKKLTQPKDTEEPEEQVIQLWVSIFEAMKHHQLVQVITVSKDEESCLAALLSFFSRNQQINLVTVLQHSPEGCILQRKINKTVAIFTKVSKYLENCLKDRKVRPILEEQETQTSDDLAEGLRTRMKNLEYQIDQLKKHEATGPTCFNGTAQLSIISGSEMGGRLILGDALKKVAKIEILNLDKYVKTLTANNLISMIANYLKTCSTMVFVGAPLPNAGRGTAAIPDNQDKTREVFVRHLQALSNFEGDLLFDIFTEKDYADGAARVIPVYDFAPVFVTRRCSLHVYQKLATMLRVQDPLEIRTADASANTREEPASTSVAMKNTPVQTEENKNDLIFQDDLEWVMWES